MGSSLKQKEKENLTCYFSIMPIALHSVSLLYHCYCICGVIYLYNEIHKYIYKYNLTTPVTPSSCPTVKQKIKLVWPYSQQCNFEGFAYTHQSHVATYKIHQVRSPPTCLNHRLKLRRDHRRRCQGLLTPQRIARKCRKLHQEYLDFLFTVHALTVRTV